MTVGGAPFGLSDVLTTLKNGVVALGSIASSIKSAFPQSGSVVNSATAGTSGPLPDQVSGYLQVTVNGEVKLVPLYNP